MPLDPNIVYLLLLGGLWLSVTAAHMPGTGIIELLAGVGIVASLYALINMPTNWWALVVLVSGVLTFLVLPLLHRRSTLLPVGGLVLQALGSLTLFSGVSVSLPVIAITVAASLIYYRFALLRILEFHKTAPAMLEDEPLVGLQGYVQKALDPVGTVYVRGEAWTARSDKPLTAGTEISVVDQEGLTLFVEAVKQKRRQEEG